ncbi:MAG: metallophosphoesterase [Cyclobacteriaceae bacterium]|nr:metallophosphoesterase [Cyclobacteriaceae bacterium]
MRTLFFFFLTLLATSVSGQEFWFWPDYTLNDKARNLPGNRLLVTTPVIPVVATEPLPLIFFGEEPTERKRGLVAANQLPTESFTIELWISNHVNKPVGALVALKPKFLANEPEWLLGYFDNKLVYSLKTQQSVYASVIDFQIKSRGFKKYWSHVVATYHNQKMSLYLNGVWVGEKETGSRVAVDASTMEMELAAYMHNEPYMQFGNLVRMVKISDHALNAKQVASRYAALSALVTKGILFPDLFHFTAGPYLTYATATGIDIVWETDRPADFEVEYGTRLPLSKKVEVKDLSVETEQGEKAFIYKVSLAGLTEETPYFYNIKAKDRKGNTMESGVLTFSTAVQTNHSYMFSIVGDTEARPHVSDRIAKMIWGERPNFLLLVGDLTDGGFKDQKFEWNYEYFAGITQLASRVPVFPVAGNGEADLFWYNQYHPSLPKDGYYKFSYGNADFFMLNSNRENDFAPGGAQYVWLEQELKKSQAKWKFVAHHHAPYSADEDDYGNAWTGTSTLGDQAIRKIVPLYEQYGVDMVFFGHLHTYQRTLSITENQVSTRKGVIYIQTGGSGGNLEDFAPSRAWFSAKTYRGHHYCTVTVNHTNLEFRMYDAEGRLKDFFNLSKAD